VAQNGSSGSNGHSEISNGSRNGHKARGSGHGEDAGNLGSYDKHEAPKPREKGTLDELMEQTRQARALQIYLTYWWPGGLSCRAFVPDATSTALLLEVQGSWFVHFRKVRLLPNPWKWYMLFSGTFQRRRRCRRDQFERSQGVQGKKEILVGGASCHVCRLLLLRANDTTLLAKYYIADAMHKLQRGLSL